MAVTGICGWECQRATQGNAAVPDERHWDNVAGVPAISTTTVRTGAAALRCNAAGAAVNLQRTIARTIVAGRFYVRFASLPASSTPFIRFVNANGAGTIEVDNAGLIKAKVGTGSLSASAGTASTGTWYRIDFLLDTSGATGSIKLQVDGGTEQTATNAQATANNTSINIGITGAATCDAFYDDSLWGDATGDYPFGAGTVDRFSPTADGTHSFTAGDFGYDTAGADVATTATDVWTKVDDTDMGSTADLIRQKVIRSTGYVEVAFGARPHSWAPLAVAVITSFHSSTTGANTAGVKLNDGGTLKNITDEAGDALSDISETAIIVNEKVLATRPNGGTAWTDAALGAITVRFGYSTDVVGIPYWDGLMLEVAYGPQPPVGSLIYNRRRPMQPHLVR